jgi:four helix bundle protein
MATARQVEELACWQQARQLVAHVYQISARGPLSRNYPLQNQMRRAAISIIANIAEGFGRYRPAEFHRFLTIAKGSCTELETLFYISTDLGDLAPDDQIKLFEMTKRLSPSLGALMRYLRSQKTAP